LEPLREDPALEEEDEEDELDEPEETDDEPEETDDELLLEDVEPEFDVLDAGVVVVV